MKIINKSRLHTCLTSPQILLPVERRAAGDPVGDEGPDARAAAPQEVLRGHLHAAVQRRQGDRRHVLRRGRDGQALLHHTAG